MIIGERLATLKELETYYSYQDALNMAEIILVQRTNERLAYEAASRKGR